MLKHHLTVALRGLIRHRLASFIALASLGVGLTGVMIIASYVLGEFSYDNYHRKADRIHRLVTLVDNDTYDGIAKVPGPWGPAAAREIPEVEDVVRLVPTGQRLFDGNGVRKYETEGIYADDHIFEIFDFPGSTGVPASALSEPNTMVVTKSFAKAYFGDSSPLGKIIRIDDQKDVKITGVIGDVPRNSHFTFDYVLSMPTFDSPSFTSWKWTMFYTYLLFREGASTSGIPEKVSAILRANMPAEEASNFKPGLQALRSIHLESNLARELDQNNSLPTVYSFIGIAVLLMLIAGTNYMILISARSATRSREIGVRKVTGAGKAILLRQFIGESIVMSAFAVFAAFILSELLIPSFNAWSGLNVTGEFLRDPRFIGTLLGFSILMGSAASFYPAMVLAGFNTIAALQGRFSWSRHAPLRRSMVAAQFTISIALMIGTGVVYRQMKYVNETNLGFDKEQLLVVPLGASPIIQKQDEFRTRLNTIPEIGQVTFSANLPGGSDWGVPIQVEGWTQGESPDVRHLIVDEDFTDAYGMAIVEGRDFSRTMATDRTGAYLINEEAAKAFGWTSPVGKTIGIEAFGRKGQVIGVVKNFHFRSLHQRIDPLIFYVEPSWNRYATIKLGTGDLSRTLAAIEEQWNAIDPVHPFSFSFFDENFERLYRRDMLQGRVLGAFAVLAVFVSCLGLFGLSSFTIVQRTKEVGIRKILGASFADIATLLSKEFFWMIILANVVAWPAAYFFMSEWLEGFAYRTDLSPSVFAGAGLVAVALAALTIGYHTIKATGRNPVEALRTE